MSLENVIKDLKSKIDSDQHYVDKLKKDIELLKHESEKVMAFMTYHILVNKINLPIRD